MLKDLITGGLRTAVKVDVFCLHLYFTQCVTIMLVFVSFSFVIILLVIMHCIRDLDYLPLSGGPQSIKVWSQNTWEDMIIIDHCCCVLVYLTFFQHCICRCRPSQSLLVGRMKTMINIESTQKLFGHISLTR